jgi:hypothetical protein
MREFDCPQPILLNAKLAGGALNVTAEPRQTATVEVRPADDTEASRDAADRTVVQLQGDTLTVEAPPHTWRLRRTGRIVADVRLPEDSRLRVRLASADGHLRGRYGLSTVDTASGDVVIEHITGALTLNAASGEVQVERVDGPGVVQTASGDIGLGYAGKDLKVDTASGDVNLVRADASVTVKTASGDIQIGAARRGDIRLVSASGDVRVGVISGTSVWLDLLTVSGTTRSDLRQLGAQGPAEGAPELNIQVRTASGNIDINRVAAATTA